MKRLYEKILQDHHRQNRQMAFLVGPRQVGKTTSCQQVHRDSHCLNWDDQGHRDLILKGPRHVAQSLQIEKLSGTKKSVVFDEIHKYGKWKTFLKGFFDQFADKTHITVTGSSRLDVFKSGGDSLMGRYFLFRMHPLSVGEILGNRPPTSSLIEAPQKIAEKKFQKLINFGGFPEPYLKGTNRFFNQWTRLRSRQSFTEDLRDLTRVQEISQLQALADVLRAQAAGVANYSRLSSVVRVSVDTVRRWFTVLSSLYFCFTIRPWSRNVRRSLVKEPKVYLWDWSSVRDLGARFENMVASHLLKAVHVWTDMGWGDFDLYYLRNKEGQEVDFLVTRDGNPWFLVEAKKSRNRELSQHLSYYQSQIKAPHAFQVVWDIPYAQANVFKEHKPIVVPARTFLSQLV